MTASHRFRPLAAVFTLLALLLLSAGAVLADSGYTGGVTARVLAKTATTANGGKVVYPCTDRAEVTAMTVELAPGASTGWHKHPNPVYAYVLAGTLSVELEDGTATTYHPGEAVIEVVDTLHNGTNTGLDPVKLAVFYLGVEGTPLVIKQDPTAGPAANDTARSTATRHGRP